MHSILVATDFSEASLNASLFAMDLAKEMKSKLILFHADYIPAPLIAEFPMEIIMTSDELKSDSESELKKLRATLLELKKLPVEIELMSRFGDPEKEVLSAAKFHEVDLIIAGMRGAGLIKGKIIGDLVTSLLHKSFIPVLLVPHEAAFRIPKNIIFAYDGKKTDPATLELLNELTKHFLAKLHIIHVHHPNESINRAGMADDLEPCFRFTNHIFKIIPSDKTDEAIEDYLKSENNEWLAVIPRKHSLIAKLFAGNHAKHLAYHSHIPVLSMPEQAT